MADYILQDPKVAAMFRSMAEMASQMPQAGSIRMVKNTLNGGELSPELGARFDQQRYATGCHACLNMIPLPQGGAMRRPGFKAMSQAQGGAQTRLLPFVFSARESRLLEFFPKDGQVSLAVWLNPQNRIDTGLIIPWQSQWLWQAQFCQSADTIYCAHASFKPGKLMRYADNSWAYQTINWLPQTPAPAIASIYHSDEAGQSGSQVRNTYVATAVNGASGEESMPSAPFSHTTWPLSSTFYNTITVTPVAGASEYRVYKLKGGVYGFIGRITEGTSFEDRNIGADTEDTPPAYRDPFQGPGDYPSLVFLHQQRLGFASSNNRPLTFWLSQAGAYENMSASLPPDADDAIEATLAGSDASRIVWTQSDRTGLAFGTEGGEWLLVASDGAALTPQDLSFQPQTFYGSEPNLGVLRAGGALLYAQKGANAVREFGYSFSEDRYQSSDLTLLARHMLKGHGITSWAWQTEPYGIAWLALTSGSLLGLTYLREHDVIAWHRHNTPNGKILSLTVVPNFASQDTLIILCQRSHDGATEYWLEYLDDDGAAEKDGPYQQDFTGLLIPCLGEAQMEGGSTWAMVKKINSIKCRVYACHPFKAKVTSQDRPDGDWKPVPHSRNPKYSQDVSDWACPISAGFRENCRLHLALDKPGVILGISCAMELADQSGGQG